MLILSRKVGESITINDNIRISILEVHGRQTKLGIDAPRHVMVHREEIYKKIVEQNQMAIQQSMSVDFLQIAKQLQEKQNS